MKDKSLGIWLITLFGVPGITILILTWLGFISETERITSTCIGSAGVFAAIIQILILRRSVGQTDNAQVPVKVKADDPA